MVSVSHLYLCNTLYSKDMWVFSLLWPCNVWWKGGKPPLLPWQCHWANATRAWFVLWKCVLRSKEGWKVCLQVCELIWSSGDLKTPATTQTKFDLHFDTDLRSLFVSVRKIVKVTDLLKSWVHVVMLQAMQELRSTKSVLHPYGKLLQR